MKIQFIYLIKKIVAFFYNIFLYCLDSSLFLFSPSLRRDILLIRLDAIGDFILWLDTAKEYKKIYPEKEITLLANNLWSELAGALPYWDHVWELDRRKFYRNPVYRLRLLAKVKKAGFQTVIQPTFSRYFFYDDTIVRCSAAKERIGSTGNFSNISPRLKRISDRWYTKLVPASESPLMELCRNAEFLRGLGAKDFQADVPVLMFNSMNTILPATVPKKYYILFPGAGARYKQWPLERYAKLTEIIYRYTGMKGLVCGGPGEKDMFERIITNANSSFQDLVGKTSLNQLAGLVKKANFLIGNDTSAIHIATAVNTPSVCILGGGHYSRFLPYITEKDTHKPLPTPVIHKMDCFNCEWKRPCQPKGVNQAVPCIDKVTVNDVWQEVKKICLCCLQ
jgi:ADP-heptose:LPS heptosyltransferase